MSYSYNIHNILSIKSDIELSLVNLISPTFDYFKINGNLEKYDLIIRFVEYKNIETNKYQEIAHGLYYSKEQGCIVSNLNIFGIRVFWEIRNLFKENTELKVSKSYKFLSKYILKVPISSVYPLCLLIRNILQIKFLLKDATFLVGSAAALNKQGIIFTGTTGSGKTATVLNVMNNPQAKYLSDDLMIIFNHAVYGFPSLISIRRYNLGLISFFKYINPCEEYRGRVLKLFKNNFDIYFLEKSLSKYITGVSREEGISKLCNFNNKIHFYFGERTLSSFPYLYKDYSLLNMQKRQLDILTEAFRDANFYILCAQDVNDYIEMLKERYK